MTAAAHPVQGALPDLDADGRTNAAWHARFRREDPLKAFVEACLLASMTPSHGVIPRNSPPFHAVSVSVSPVSASSTTAALQRTATP